MAYHNLILKKCEDSQELISNLGKLNEERMALQKVIEMEEKEKAKLEQEAEDILKKLSAVTMSLGEKIKTRVEFDKAIKQGELTVKNLLETYKSITGVLRNRFSLLANDEIIVTETTTTTTTIANATTKSKKKGKMDVDSLKASQKEHNSAKEAA